LPRSVAVHEGLRRSHQQGPDIKGAWIKELHVRVSKGKVDEYQVNMLVTFVLDD
jgi:flavin-binding protein dodecin